MTETALTIVALIAGLAIGVCSHEYAHTIPLRLAGVDWEYTFVTSDGWLASRGLSIPLVNSAPAIRYAVGPFRISNFTRRASSLAPLFILVGLWGSSAAFVDASEWAAGFWLMLFFSHVPSLSDLRMWWHGHDRRLLAARAEFHRAHRHHRAAEGVQPPPLTVPGE